MHLPVPERAKLSLCFLYVDFKCLNFVRHCVQSRCIPFHHLTNFLVDIRVFVNPLKFFLDFFSPPRRKKFQSLLVRPYISFFRHFQRKKQAFVEFCFEKTAWPFDIRYPREWRESFGYWERHTHYSIGLISLLQSIFSSHLVKIDLKSISDRLFKRADSDRSEIDLKFSATVHTRYALSQIDSRSI